MRMNFLLIRLHCRGGIVDVDFSQSITYFWGQTGVGKSTIPRLIDFCLGGELVETPAIRQELLKTDLHLQIEEYEVRLEREKGSNQILATFRKGTGPWLQVLAPTKPRGVPVIPDRPDIESISDLIFYFSGHSPPKVRKSKGSEDDMELIRLSFRDLIWYCYLKQEQMDSSFFYLYRDEDWNRSRKSQDVMRLILGFHQERVAELENQLSAVNQERQALIDAATKLEDMISQTDIKSVEHIVSEIDSQTAKLNELDSRISNIRNELNRSVPDPVQSLRLEAKELSALTYGITASLRNYDYKVQEQDKLYYEFVTAGTKVKRANNAREILKDTTFVTCPQCGAGLSGRAIPPENCPLCTQSYEKKSELDLQAIEHDLSVRLKEISTSIENLKQERELLAERLEVLQKRKDDLDIQIERSQETYNSRYLEQTLILERERSRTSGRIEEMHRILSLLKKINDLKSQHDQQAATEERLRRQLKEARQDAERDTSSLSELEELFLESLRKSEYPDLDEEHYVEISTKDFVPKIKHRKNKFYDAQYSTLGSGGKKTLFKACFAVAIHRFVARRKIDLFPAFLIIDGPMKNLSKNENPEIYRGFYNHVYELAIGELAAVQVIFVDSEIFKPDIGEYPNLKIRDVEMTLSEQAHPRLIPWYRD